MGMAMKSRDLGLLLTIVVLSAVFSFIGLQVLGTMPPAQQQSTLIFFDRVTIYVSALVILAGIFSIAKARGLWGGELARNLEVIGAGMGLFMLTYIPHIEWHVSGLGSEPAFLGPQLLSQSAPFWAGFFHTLTLMSFLVTSYGFYLFWKLGKE